MARRKSISGSNEAETFLQHLTQTTKFGLSAYEAAPDFMSKVDDIQSKIESLEQRLSRYDVKEDISDHDGTVLVVNDIDHINEEEVYDEWSESTQKRSLRGVGRHVTAALSFSTTEAKVKSLADKSMLNEMHQKVRGSRKVVRDVKADIETELENLGIAMAAMVELSPGEEDKTAERLKAERIAAARERRDSGKGNGKGGALIPQPPPTARQRRASQKTEERCQRAMMEAQVAATEADASKAWLDALEVIYRDMFEQVDNSYFRGYSSRGPQLLPGKVDHVVIMTNVTHLLGIKSEEARLAFAHLFLSKEAQSIVLDCFWWILVMRYSTLFREDCEMLLDRVCQNFAKLFSVVPSRKKDSFFRRLTDAVSQAIFYAFKCAFYKRSRFFDDSFKQSLLAQVSQWFCGLDHPVGGTAHWIEIRDIFKFLRGQVPIPTMTRRLLANVPDHKVAPASMTAREREPSFSLNNHTSALHPVPPSEGPPSERERTGSVRSSRRRSSLFAAQEVMSPLAPAIRLTVPKLDFRKLIQPRAAPVVAKSARTRFHMFEGSPMMGRYLSLVSGLPNSERHVSLASALASKQDRMVGERTYCDPALFKTKLPEVHSRKTVARALQHVWKEKNRPMIDSRRKDETVLATARATHLAVVAEADGVRESCLEDPKLTHQYADYLTASILQLNLERLPNPLQDRTELSNVH
jgi:hypothetical protein